jgi:hypothetical protein
LQLAGFSGAAIVNEPGTYCWSELGARDVERAAAFYGAGGRTALVELTDAGHRLIEGSVERLLRHEEHLIDHLPPPERDQLTELLRKLLDGLIARTEGDAGRDFGPVGG